MRVRESISVRKDSGGSTNELHVSYTYEVDGRKYFGFKVSPASQTAGSDRWARRALAEIRSQSPLRAYVNPRRPAEAYLTNRVSPSIVVLALILGIGFIAIGIVILARSEGMPSN